MFTDFVKIREYEIIDSDKMTAYNPRNNTKVQVIITSEKLDMSFFHIKRSEIDEDIQHLIFIYKVATIQIKKLRTYKNSLRLELFFENELKRLLHGNRLIPPHIRISTDEQNHIIQKFGKENLPLILNTDPIVRLYDFDLDTIILIKRKNGIYYRLVTNE